MLYNVYVNYGLKFSVRDVAVAILTHHDQWNDSKTTMKACEEVKGQLTTPMRMLIEKMPGIIQYSSTVGLSWVVLHCSHT